MEAFASRLPVVTTNVPGVEDLDSCIKVERDEDLIENISNYILRIQSNQEFRECIISNQYKEIQEKYTLEKVSLEYVKAYKAAIDGD